MYSDKFYDSASGLDICLPWDGKCKDRKATEAQAKLLEAQALAQAAASPVSGGGNTVLIASIVIVVLLILGLVAYLKFRK